MKLTDLHPEWYGAYGRVGPNRLGVRFDCPTCTASGTLDSCSWGGDIYVPFKNPIDGAVPIGSDVPEPGAYMVGTMWQRTGETFDDLTLTPSVNAVGHWHGFVTNGQVSTC